MITATQLLHRRAANAPPAEGCGPLPLFRCWLCGGDSERGRAAVDWPATFTNQNKVRAPDSPYVCEACCHTCAWNCPPDKRKKPEDKKGPNFQNYSHLLALGPDGKLMTYASASKGEKPKILEFLSLAHPGTWFAAIADSGQKHVLPWTPINPGGIPVRSGMVLFEEQLVRLPGAAGFELVREMADLLTDGATKEDIGRGDYSVGSLLRCEAAILSFEAERGHQRGSPWWNLALWLAQRDELKVQARMEREKVAKAAQKGTRATRSTRATHRTDGVPDVRGAPGVHADGGVQCPEALGATSDADALGDADQRDRRRVGDGDGARSPAGPTQLGLFPQDR